MTALGCVPVALDASEMDFSGFDNCDASPQAARFSPCSLFHFQYSFALQDRHAALRLSGVLGPPNSKGCWWSSERSPSFLDRSFLQTAHL